MLVICIAEESLRLNDKEGIDKDKFKVAEIGDGETDKLVVLIISDENDEVDSDGLLEVSSMSEIDGKTDEGDMNVNDDVELLLSTIVKDVDASIDAADTIKLLSSTIGDVDKVGEGDRDVVDWTTNSVVDDCIDNVDTNVCDSCKELAEDILLSAVLS